LGRRISSIRRYQILLGEILSTCADTRANSNCDSWFRYTLLFKRMGQENQQKWLGLSRGITKKVAKKIFSLLALGFLFPLFIDTIKFTKKNIIEMVASILTVGTIGILLPTVSCMLMRDNCIGIVIALLPILVLEIVYIILVGEQENEEEA